MQLNRVQLKSIKFVSTFTVVVFLAFLAVSPFSARQLTEQMGNAAAAPRFSCRSGLISGTYGANITGTFLTPSPVPLAAVGTFNFNEARQVSGTATTSFGGAVTTSPFTGSYALNDDCTGTMSTTQDGFTINSNIVLVNEGDEIVVIETNPGAVVTGVLKRR